MPELSPVYDRTVQVSACVAADISFHIVYIVYKCTTDPGITRTHTFDSVGASHIYPSQTTGIMHKISPLVGPLRATPPIIGSEEERARREYTVQMSKRGLIDLCQQEASRFLVQGRYDLAVPGAIQVCITMFYRHLDVHRSSPVLLFQSRYLTIQYLCWKAAVVDATMASSDVRIK